jgi:hypothetical protein
MRQVDLAAAQPLPKTLLLGLNSLMTMGLGEQSRAEIVGGNSPCKPILWTFLSRKDLTFVQMYLYVYVRIQSTTVNSRKNVK